MKKKDYLTPATKWTASDTEPLMAASDGITEEIPGGDGEDDIELGARRDNVNVWDED